MLKCKYSIRKLSYF
ncbi:YSIRK-type signal peptide-containing protein [Aeribacillus sp. FSL M8-0254]